MFERLKKKLKGKPRAPGKSSATRALDWLAANGKDDQRKVVVAALAAYGIGQSDLESVPEGADDERLAELEATQMADGGFPGHDTDARRRAAAQYLLGHRRRVIALMEAMADQFPDQVADDDGRLLAVAAYVKPAARVLEAGCGKGRFLAALKRKFPGVECVGVDIAPGLLKRIPAGIKGAPGSLEAIPFEAGVFDVAFSVEAIEHATNWAAAVMGLCRVVKPGGRVIIVDKQQAAWGRFETPVWERWPEKEELKALLSKFCDDVRADDVGYDGKPADGLMLAWSGRKK